MRKLRALISALLAAFLATSCSTPPGQQTKTGAGAGALIGAGAGALVGNPFIGFIAGSAIGAVTGHQKEHNLTSTPPWDEALTEAYPEDTASSAVGLTSYEQHHPYHGSHNQLNSTLPAAHTGDQTASDYTSSAQTSPPYDDAESDPFYVAPNTFYR